MSTTSDKPRSRLPRLRKVPGLTASSQNAFHSNNSIHGPTSVHSGSTSLAPTRNFHKSRIPRLPTTTLFATSSRMISPPRDLMTETLPRMPSTSSASNKPTSRIPRLPGSTLRVHECNQNAREPIVSTNSSLYSVSTSVASTTSSAIDKIKSKIPRRRATTLSLNQNNTPYIPTADSLTTNILSMTKGPPTINSTKPCLEPVMTTQDYSSTVELPTVDNTSDSAPHPVTPIVEHNMEFANELNSFAESLFKSFDEFEENQRKRFEEFSPSCSTTPSDACAFDESPLTALEGEIRQLKNQVAVLEMDKADLIKQLEIANQHCSALQRRIISFQRNDIQSSTCQDQSFDCVSEAEDAQAKTTVVDDHLVALQRLSKESRRFIDEMNGTLGRSQEVNLDNAAKMNSISCTLASIHEHLDDNRPMQINSFCQKSAFENGQVQVEDAHSKTTVVDDHLVALQRLSKESRRFIDEMNETLFQSDQATHNVLTCDDTHLCFGNDRNISVANDLLQAPLEPKPNHADTAPRHTGQSWPLAAQPQEIIDNDCVANMTSISAELEPVNQPFDDANQMPTTFCTAQTDLEDVNHDWLDAMYASNDRIISIICEFLQAPLEQKPESEDTTTTITDRDPISNCSTMDMTTTSPKQRTLNLSADSVNSPSASLLSSMEPSQFLSIPPTAQTCDSTETSSVATTCSGIDCLATTCVAMSPTRVSVQVNENVNTAETNDQDDSRSMEADSTECLNNLVSQVYDAWISDSFQYTSLYSHSAIMRGEGHAQDLLEKSFGTRFTSKNSDAVVHIAQDDTPCREPSATIIGDNTPSTSLFSSPRSMEPHPCISFAPIDQSCEEMQSPSIATTCPDINVDRLAAMCSTISRGCASAEMDENVAIADPNYLEDSFSIEPDEKENVVLADPNYLERSFTIDTKDNTDKDNTVMEADPTHVLNVAGIIEHDIEQCRVTTAVISENREDTGLHSRSKILHEDDYDFLDTSFEIQSPSKSILYATSMANEEYPSRKANTMTPKINKCLQFPQSIKENDKHDFLETSFEIEAPNMTIFATEEMPSRTTTAKIPKNHTSLPTPSNVMDEQDFLELSFELAPRDIAVDSTMDSSASQVPRESICEDRRISYLNENHQVNHKAINDSNYLDKVCAIAATSDKIPPTANLAKMEELRQASNAWVEQDTFDTESQLYSTSPMDEEINCSKYIKETLSTQQYNCRMDLDTHANLDFHLFMRRLGVQV